MKILGIDPDTKNTGLAGVEFEEWDHVSSRNGASVVTSQVCTKMEVIWVAVAKAKLSLPVADRILVIADQLAYILNNCPSVKAAVIEGQVAYPRSRVRPNDLIHLAQVTGAALGVCESNDQLFGIMTEPHITVVKPRDWKGTVKKDVHQRRIMSKVTMDNPTWDLLSPLQQGHVKDAIGLALWGYEQC